MWWFGDKQDEQDEWDEHKILQDTTVTTKNWKTTK